MWVTFTPLTCSSSTDPYVLEIKLLNYLFWFFTEAGRLMALYCVAFDTMKQFCEVTGTETLSDLVGFLANTFDSNAISATFPSVTLDSCQRKISGCIVYCI